MKAACIPPVIPNGNYTESPNGWFRDRHAIRIKCDEGYEHKDQRAIAICINGEWSSLPVCESKSVTHFLLVNWKTNSNQNNKSAYIILSPPTKTKPTSSEHILMTFFNFSQKVLMPVMHLLKFLMPSSFIRETRRCLLQIHQCNMNVKMDSLQRTQTRKQSFALLECGLKAQRAVSG